jgi:hypothetical protein
VLPGDGQRLGRTINGRRVDDQLRPAVAVIRRKGALLSVHDATAEEHEDDREDRTPVHDGHLKPPGCLVTEQVGGHPCHIRANLMSRLHLWPSFGTALECSTLC